ncbi:type VI secretion system-associated protein TagF [Niveibacterium umoris]|uniref:Type VI secretion system protein ImpM n=1 Tax=Niveibacterium umoris TaxID=1193620 RepID=A0A840BQ46_9RHOO|nr:type VI secretion system-associated protein TagF [Niveibacterium umoris]MBB4012547.1 type VI secretion system protein ImpM [Niveibacterium umoris]
MTDLAGRVCYFGKLPTRADFVRSASGAPILDSLDAWVAHGLELAAIDPGWKSAYDRCAPANFVFLGARSPVALVGRLVPSQDASQRRFPFISAVALPADSPLGLVANFPACFEPVWQQLATAMDAVRVAEDPRLALEALSALEFAPVAPLAAEALQPEYDALTLADLERSLRAAGHPVVLRRSVLAIGLLLEPLLTQTSSRMQRGLALPLPATGDARTAVASWWTAAVAPFLARADFELGALTVTRGGRPELMLSFAGADARTLQALLSPSAAQEYLIDICDAEWVEDYLDNDYAISKLASYLDIPRLSLRQAAATFGEAFLGR